MSEPAYTPCADDLIDGQQGGPRGQMPQLPDEQEARAWVLSTCEGKTQAEIAELLGRSQGVVSRMVDRATAKINRLVSLGWISRAQVERNIRRAVGHGLGPRT